MRFVDHIPPALLDCSVALRGCPQKASWSEGLLYIGLIALTSTAHFLSTEYAYFLAQRAHIHVTLRDAFSPLSFWGSEGAVITNAGSDCR